MDRQYLEQRTQQEDINDIQAMIRLYIISIMSLILPALREKPVQQTRQRIFRQPRYSWPMQDKVTGTFHPLLVLKTMSKQFKGQQRSLKTGHNKSITKQNKVNYSLLRMKKTYRAIKHMHHVIASENEPEVQMLSEGLCPEWRSEDDEVGKVEEYERLIGELNMDKMEFQQRLEQQRQQSHIEIYSRDKMIQQLVEQMNHQTEQLEVLKMENSRLGAENKELKLYNQEICGQLSQMEEQKEIYCRSESLDNPEAVISKGQMEDEGKFYAELQKLEQRQEEKLKQMIIFYQQQIREWKEVFAASTQHHFQVAFPNIQPVYDLHQPQPSTSNSQPQEPAQCPNQPTCKALSLKQDLTPQPYPKELLLWGLLILMGGLMGAVLRWVPQS